MSSITRSSAGLVDAMFDSMENLNAKKIDAEHARALSHTAKSIVAIANLELEYRKFKSDNADTDEKLISLTIDTPLVEAAE